MPRTVRLAALKQIAAIRSAQEQVAELAAQRLGAERRRLEGAQDQALERRRSEVLSWAEAMTGRPMNMTLSGAWSGRILLSDGELKLLQRRLEANQKHVDAAAAERVKAKARSDVAETLVGRARRALGRRRDEARLQDLADRLTSDRSRL